MEFVHHEFLWTWCNEKTTPKNGNKEVEKALKKLKEQNLVFEGKIEAPQGDKKKNSETRNQLLFRSTEFGDDKDRALKKGDDSWTYFAGDLAYHNNKISRNFDILINILGADHAGYIKRISSVVDALSKNKQKIECKVTQLVKLIKDNKPFKMSKRKGDYITLEDLINEVGKDAARFIMLSRVSDVELEFDFEDLRRQVAETIPTFTEEQATVYNTVMEAVKNQTSLQVFLSARGGCGKTYLLNGILDSVRCLEPGGCVALAMATTGIAANLLNLGRTFHSRMKAPLDPDENSTLKVIYIYNWKLC